MRITLYLLRTGITVQDDVLRDSGTYQQVPLAPVNGAEWRQRLYVRPGIPRAAGWVEHIEPLVLPSDRGTLDRLRSSQSSGILLVEASGRCFALTFGGGYFSLDGRCIEPGFGLRVTANAISANQVRGSATKGLGRSSRSQRTALPSDSELYELGIEPTDEWVRQLSGKVTETTFATSADGADSLRLSVRGFTLNALPKKLAQIHQHYSSDRYKRDFGFLDNLVQLGSKDPLVPRLDDDIRQRLAARDDSLSFAPPDPFEQLHVDRYKLTCRRSFYVDELTAGDVFGTLDQFARVADPLVDVHVTALDDAGSPVDRRFALRDYVQAEVKLDDSRYVLTAGTWFRVSASYVDDVTKYVAGIEDLTSKFDLPIWDRNALAPEGKDAADEGDYNQHVAKAANYLLLDKKDVRGIGGASQKIEICDLLTADKQLLCVKRATKSSTLSHLFAQGSVSASLMTEPKYQGKVMGHLQSLNPAAQYEPHPSWTFVYAIATAKPGPLADSLFFFSKANLVKHARDIESRGYRVALARIELK